jgi:hypothetical protein
MTKDGSLRIIGEIAVNWASVESCVLRLLWLYVGTDRPTFNIITAKLRPTDRESMLKDLANRKEPNDILRADVLTALQWVKVLRENRNVTLHGLGDGVIPDADWPIHELGTIGRQLSEICPVLNALCENATRVVMSRDAAEPPIGKESFPGDDSVQSHSPINWPQKPKKMNPWRQV